MLRRRSFILSLFLSLPAALPAAGKKPKLPRHFMATAHSVEGETASGTKSRPGTAAADPNVLPLGTRIRVTGAGRYSGDYSVEDTGRAVKGNEIDLYMKSNAEAKKFGRQRVQVKILSMPEPKS